MLSRDNLLRINTNIKRLYDAGKDDKDIYEYLETVEKVKPDDVYSGLEALKSRDNGTLNVPDNFSNYSIGVPRAGTEYLTPKGEGFPTIKQIEQAGVKSSWSETFGVKPGGIDLTYLSKKISAGALVLEVLSAQEPFVKGQPTAAQQIIGEAIPRSLAAVFVDLTSAFGPTLLGKGKELLWKTKGEGAILDVERLAYTSRGPEVKSALQSLTKDQYLKVQKLAKSTINKLNQNKIKSLVKLETRLNTGLEGYFSKPRGTFEQSVKNFLTVVQIQRQLLKMGEKPATNPVETLLNQVALHASEKSYKQTAVKHLSNLLLRRGKEVLKSYGKEGTALSQRLTDWDSTWKVEAGRLTYDIIDSFSNLSKKEYATLLDIYKNGKQPISQNQANAIFKMRHIFNYFANRAGKNGVKVTGKEGVKGGFIALENYFPEIHDLSMLQKEKYLNRIATQMVKNKSVRTILEAKKIIDNYVNMRVSGKFPSLEYARTSSIPGAETDPLKVMLWYIEGASKRLGFIERWGQDGLGMEQALERISKESGDDAANLARKIIASEVKGKASSVFSEADDLFRLLRNFNTFTKMEWASIPNAFQKVNGTLRTDLSSTAKALMTYKSKESLKFAIRSGALLESIAREAEQKLGSEGSLVGSMLKYTGFTGTEQANRVFSTTAGKIYITRMGVQLIKDPSNKQALYALREVGINPDKVLTRGYINQKELLAAAQKISNETQFRADPISLPYFWSTPEGKLAMQFKNFAYNQAIFLYDSLKRAKEMEGAYGIAKTALKWAVIFGASGEVVADIRALIAGRKRESNLVLRWLDNLMWAGGVGLMSDMLSSVLYGKESIYKAMSGPSISTGVDVVSALASLDVGKIGTEATKMIPVFGDLIYNWGIKRQRKGWL